MDKSVLDCLVTDYEPLIEALKLPDEGDRHVLAAAIVGKASVIVTFNEGDFPAKDLEQFGLHTKHPDDRKKPRRPTPRIGCWGCSRY